MSGGMAEAVQNMLEHRVRSVAVDRTGWTDEQWIADARALMDDVDGSVQSLVNGHVLALLRAVPPKATDRADLLAVAHIDALDIDVLVTWWEESGTGEVAYRPGTDARWVTWSPPVPLEPAP